MTALGATIPLVQVSVRLCQSAGLCWTLPWGLVSPARPPSKPAGRGFGESPHEEERAELRLHSSLETSKAKGRALVFCFPFSIQGVGWETRVCNRARAASRCSCHLPGHDKCGEGTFSFGLHSKHPVSDVTPQSRSPGPDPCSKQRGKFRWFSPGRGPESFVTPSPKTPSSLCQAFSPWSGGGGCGSWIWNSEEKKGSHRSTRERMGEFTEKSGFIKQGVHFKGRELGAIQKGKNRRMG